ncbi:hypothetical protein [Marinomonas transparens]|uniref:Exotoxin A catalytic domain-containing protein n=1 Tax=Marinomonas transparens TaxID=2795388 RepID=A0A934MX93_9GAMM|nr:hypothetical protein [Marinomonas transparens]MBJ7539064.1 hypothetical protein [Marinomonas transparens]
MKIRVIKLKDHHFPHLLKTAKYISVTLLAFASFSVQAERVRTCHVIPVDIAIGIDYNGDPITAGGYRYSAPYTTAGRHGGIQANTARKRAVARYKACAEQLVNNPTKNVEDISECNNNTAGSSNPYDMSYHLGPKSLTEKYACPHAIGSTSQASFDSNFFIDVKKFTVSGETSGLQNCSSTISKTASVQNIKLSQFHCKDIYYPQYSLNTAFSNPRYSGTSVFVAMMNGIKDMMEILASESDVDKIFGEGHQSKASELLTMLEQAKNNQNTSALKQWMPHVSEYQELSGAEVLGYNGLTVNNVDGTLPPFQAVYDRSKKAIYMSDQALYTRDEITQCTMVQALAQHVSHYFDGFNGLKTEILGSEGMLAALRICNPSIFSSLTDEQIEALQRKANYADVRLHGKYNIHKVGLSFWSYEEDGLALNSLLPESAEVLLEAPVVSVAGNEVMLQELSDKAKLAHSLNEVLVMDSSGYGNIIGSSEAIAHANDTLSAVALLDRPYDANKLHDFTGSQLHQVHLYLHAGGYQFVGYRLEPQYAVAQAMVNEGVARVEQPEYEQSDDNYANRRQWKGLNVSEDIELASQAGIDNQVATGRILRVYLPSDAANRLYNFGPYLDTPEADSLARELVGSDINFSSVNDLEQLYLMRGRAKEGYGNSNGIDYTETFISWALAERAIVIPAARQIDPSRFELEVINTANRWEGEVPIVAGRSDIVQ